MFRFISQIMMFIVGISFFILIPIVSNITHGTDVVQDGLKSKDAVVATGNLVLSEDGYGGEEIMYLVYQAVKGELILNINGIQIDSSTDVGTVNPHAIMGNRYDINYEYVDAISEYVAVVTGR